MAELTPMMQQYFEIKKEYQDTILFFRLGDFYEMFFDDAIVASKELELTLTGRSCGQEERAPMCGVPYHSADSYIASLVKAGYKVAICEQTETPEEAEDKIVKREVVRVVTPGTVIEHSMLDESKNNYLSAVYADDEVVGICFIDISTGAAHVTQAPKKEMEEYLPDELSKFSPSEIIISENILLSGRIKKFITNELSVMLDTKQQTEDFLKEHMAVAKNYMQKRHIENQNLIDHLGALCALGMAIVYLQETQKSENTSIISIDYYQRAQFMKLDYSARRNLELVETMRTGEKKGSLLWVLDSTKTSMGKRLLRQWIEQPLIQCAKIIHRQNAVQELFDDSILRSKLTAQLGQIYDIERLMSRVVYGTANARELKSLSFTIKNIQPIKAMLAKSKSYLLSEIERNIDVLEDIEALIEAAIVEEPPFSVREGGMISGDFNNELDELRNIVNDGKGYLAKIEEDEREKTGIKNLKIGYNRVFGYYLEVTNSYKELVPETYIRKQTLTNAERYITQELKDLESKVLGAQERIVQLEYQIYIDVRDTVAKEIARVQRTARAIAQLDVLNNFANVSEQNRYQCPQMDESDVIDIRDGRHPVVEKMLAGEPFVPNNALLDCNDNRIAIITGPNMAGKSTYMRQVAHIVLMAQIGCFVPVQSANIGVVDRVFTRVGASDDLAAGQSTFMVEMSEVAHILKYATKKSLIILDEIGRGTSTFDGMSIAQAVVEYVSNPKKLGAKTLFATHYHELTELENHLDGVKNYSVSVKKRGEDITFLHRIVKGGADGSYGIDVARLAGVPREVVSRAHKILKTLEAQNIRVLQMDTTTPVIEEENLQVTLGDNVEASIIDELSKLDINTLTPIESMKVLHELIEKAKL